ncbi:transcriptional regulator of RNA polII, SAGA, subunit-domain-containing protein [Amylocarpus encephaloides]|uniref:Transcriptional regulator of RNA polII, SAGA, subunit-domain-containing protein n=1 Tax=Amylocarpus encephaloides TaxID=45428 RepID=A0A9P7YJT3_9HELO|nr:transcriptional regulator of RNA polII, SAGA, subunit-domain-containing protein [Amylocarpus encephaloides]
MPDIDPAALSRPAISTTPILPPKTLSTSVSNVPKVAKSNHVPPRIDLEPLYATLKASIGEHWKQYKEALGLFMIGKLDQSELCKRIDHFVITPTCEIEHCHNQLIAAVYANVTREMPDHGVASWVSANDKPTVGTGSKPVSGDAAEQRLKTEVMQLPSRDRRRIKDLSQNEFDPQDAFANIFGEHRRPKVARLSEPVPASAGGLNKTNWDLEIRKRYAQTLAVESGEFPDTQNIESRMLPICYEGGLTSGHVTEAAQFMSVATETFLKEVLSSIFSKTRTNGPGMAGSAGTGGGANWVQTQKYRLQLEREEEAWMRGEMQRDKGGLLPIEARAASDRAPLGMADVRTALELGDCGLGQMPVILEKIVSDYREGELEAWDDYSYPEGFSSTAIEEIDRDVEMGGITGLNGVNGVNGLDHNYDAESDSGWIGGEYEDKADLDNLLDSCLAIGA